MLLKKVICPKRVLKRVGEFLQFEIWTLSAIEIKKKALPDLFDLSPSNIENIVVSDWRISREGRKEIVRLRGTNILRDGSIWLVKSLPLLGATWRFMNTMVNILNTGPESIALVRTTRSASLQLNSTHGSIVTHLLNEESSSGSELPISTLSGFFLLYCMVSVFSCHSYYLDWGGCVEGNQFGVFIYHFIPILASRNTRFLSVLLLVSCTFI